MLLEKVCIFCPSLFIVDIFFNGSEILWDFARIEAKFISAIEKFSKKQLKVFKKCG
jgi:hypothetical protein